MADLFKLAGRDVLVAEALTAKNVSNIEADSVFNSMTAANINDSARLAADVSGKIIPSPITYVTVTTAQDISGIKTFTAPALASGEQPTTIFKTANGGRIIFGKEGANSGSMIALEQEEGTRRLNFRSSTTPGAMVWEQPETSSCLFYDVSRVEFRKPSSINFTAASNIVFNQFKSAAALGTDANGNLIKVDLSDKYLEKGNASTVIAQTVYNPVELKKALVVPSVKGSNSANSISNGASLFELGGTMVTEGGQATGRSQLSLSGYASATSVPYVTTITQNSDGAFVITPKVSTNTSARLLWSDDGKGWCIDDKKITTNDVLADTRNVLAEHITGQAGDWIWLGKVAEKTYSLDLSEIKPGASGTTTGATCYVTINTFQQTVGDKKQYKTVIDATCRCEPFELKHIDLKVLLSDVGSKWFMPRMYVSRGAMMSTAFNTMMDKIYTDRAYIGIAVDECSVFRDMSTSLGTLNANGSVSPIYGMNTDGFSLFACIMELDRDNADKSIFVSGAHYRMTIFHPNTIL